MTIALVTTTINVPTVLEGYRKILGEDDIIIVAGDLKSPHDEIHKLLHGLPGVNRYLDPAWQSDNDTRTSRMTPWNCIQRRNVAILEAIRSGADHVLTIDDDNIPLPGYLETMMKPYASRPTSELTSEGGWWNVGSMLSPQITHRGFPYAKRHMHYPYDQSYTTGDLVPGVVAGTWLGDPDIDAMERLVNAPEVTAHAGLGLGGVALAPGTWCPFNSQNTLWRGDLAPLMMCWPGVGRFDDIWASYAARAVMDARGDAMVFVEPTVRQERNDHDLFKDLEDELFGYRNTDFVCDRLRAASAEVKEESVIDAWWFVVTSIFDVVPVLTRDTMAAWCADVKEITE